jgi:hypothetical protein
LYLPEGQYKKKGKEQIAHLICDTNMCFPHLQNMKPRGMALELFLSQFITLRNFK